MRPVHSLVWFKWQVESTCLLTNVNEFDTRERILLLELLLILCAVCVCANNSRRYCGRRPFTQFNTYTVFQIIARANRFCSL